jgi:hypothetical protein
MFDNAGLAEVGRVRCGGGGSWGDERWCAVGRFTSLRHVNIGESSRSSARSCADITDEGLDHLGQLTRLRILNLYGCSKVTRSGVNRLRERFPQLRILQPTFLDSPFWSSSPQVAVLQSPETCLRRISLETFAALFAFCRTLRVFMRLSLQRFEA